MWVNVNVQYYHLFVAKLLDKCEGLYASLAHI